MTTDHSTYSLAIDEPIPGEYPVPTTNVQWQISEPTRPYDKFQQIKTGVVNSTAKPQQRNQTPCIELSGDWLNQAGFSKGTHYRVEVYRGSLILVAE